MTFSQWLNERADPALTGRLGIQTSGIRQMKQRLVAPLAQTNDQNRPATIANFLVDVYSKVPAEARFAAFQKDFVIIKRQLMNSFRSGGATQQPNPVPPGGTQPPPT